MRRLIVIMLWIGCFYTRPAMAQLAADITNLSDMTLPAWSIGDPAVAAHMDLCVYSVGSALSGGYAVTVSSGGGFNLTSGVNQIPYQLYWEDSGAGNLGSGSGTQLFNGVKLSNQANANILSSLCALGVTGPNARLDLKITQADMTAALAGTYSGTISILISPN